MTLLPRGPLQQAPSVTRDVSSGKGLSADEAGRSHISSANGRWHIEYVTSDVNIPNTTTDTGGALTPTITGLRVGDLCFFMGKDDTARQFIVYTNPVCTTAEQITLHYFNTTGGSLDPASGTFHFLVIHRNII